MVKIICGRAHSGRESALFDEIERAAQGSRAAVIMPDQYSFELDKRLYDRLGARLFNRVQTFGISALGERICRGFGGAGEQADSASMLIAMYRAQSALKKEHTLQYFSRSLLKPTFVSDCIALSKQLLRAGASPETIRLAAEGSAVASARLSDIAVIFEKYLKCLEELDCCSLLSATAKAAQIIKDENYFKDTVVFFEGFTNFSADELSLVRSTVSSASDAAFSFVLAEDGPDGSDSFAQTIRTRSRILEICSDLQKDTQIVNAGGSFRSKALEHLDRELYAYKPTAADSQGAVKIAAGDDIYQECEYVCAEICRLAREEGLRFSETAIICGGFEENAPIAASAAEKYGLPCFTDKSAGALTSVPAKYLMSILDAALTEKYRTENILRIIKSPLSPIFDFDACDIEDLCIKWRIEGDMWSSPFISDGNAKDERIEATRRAVIEPLDTFKSKAENATAGEICQALFELLDSLEMSKQVYSQVRASAAAGSENDLEISRSFKQVWLGMVGSVKKIYDTMENEPMSLRAFSELLRLMLADIKISAPPQQSDCIRIAEAGRSRISGVKTLFIIHANDGVFPKNISSDGIMTAADINKLSQFGAELESSPQIMLDSERMSVYSAVSAPSERIYITYAEADRTGAAIAPSALAQTVEKMFSDDIFIRISSLPQEFFCVSFKSAFSNYLEHSNDNTVETASIGESLKYSEEYFSRLKAVNAAASRRVGDLEQDTARGLFFPDGTKLSATRMTDFYKCPYMYFCRYGLRLSKPQPAEIDGRYFGLIIHKCLETVMSRLENGKKVYNEKFTKMTQRQLAVKINRTADSYVEREMGGDFGKDLTFRFTLKKAKSAALTMAVNFRDELKSSLFLPVAFEYDISDSGSFSAVTPDGEELKIDLRGYIDRIDVFKTENGGFLRITDYKTGSQKFDEAKIYNGLGLQMLIYLLAAVNASKNGALPGCSGVLEPAGVMYSHLKFAEPVFGISDVAEFENSGEMNEKLREAYAKSYKPDGAMLGKEIDIALNKELDGAYTIFNYKKDGDYSKNSPQPVSRERLIAMEQFALDKAYEMVRRLNAGEIPADPLKTNDNSPCAYCDYFGVCPSADPKEPREISDLDADMLERELEKIIERNDEQ